jgi:hypothetical protein
MIVVTPAPGSDHAAAMEREEQIEGQPQGDQKQGEEDE